MLAPGSIDKPSVAGERGHAEWPRRNRCWEGGTFSGLAGRRPQGRSSLSSGQGWGCHGNQSWVGRCWLCSKGDARLDFCREVEDSGVGLNSARLLSLQSPGQRTPWRTWDPAPAGLELAAGFWLLSRTRGDEQDFGSQHLPAW